MRSEVSAGEKIYTPNAITFRENEIISETCDVYRLSLTDEQVLRLLKKMHYPLKHEVTDEEIKESKNSFYLFKGKKEFFELLKQTEENKIQIFYEEDCGMPQLSNISDWIEMLDDYIHNSFDFAGTGRHYGRRISDSSNLRNHIWYIENPEDIFGKK